MDIVERLNEESLALQQTAWNRIDGGQQCSLSANLADEAAAEIERLRAENAELLQIIGDRAIERADAREALFPQMSARIAAERQQARAEAFERAAQIADDHGFLNDDPTGHAIAAAIRQEATRTASGESGGQR